MSKACVYLLHAAAHPVRGGNSNHFKLSSVGGVWWCRRRVWRVRWMAVDFVCDSPCVLGHARDVSTPRRYTLKIGNMRKRGLYNSYHSHTPIENEQFDPVYEHDLQMYVVPPARGNVRLDELYKWSFDRLRVLGYVAEVEKKRLKFALRLPALLQLLEQNNLTEFATLYNVHSDCDPCIRKRLVIFDGMAHFLLKSAFAFDTKKISWFVRQEVNLFAWRLCSFPLTSVRRFMKLNDITYPTISMEERREISQALESYRTPKEVEEMNFYKVYFTHVKDLVAHGQVYLRHGTAHVPEPKMGHPIVHNFSKKLKFSAAQGRWVHGMNSSDERFANLTKLLLESAEGYFKRTDNPDEITYEDLDSLSKRSYPLCMRIVHEALRRDHHLTNGGRVQYTLFLKGIGLPFDAAFRLWSTEFRRIVPREEFETEYRYYVEHLYGRVGRMADYQPFGCSKIIDTVLLPRDCHGCPYKSMSTPLLRTTLQEHGLLKLDVEEIIALTERSEHLQACKRYYEATHEVVLSAPFMHPNDYFRSSCERFREAEEWAEEAEEKNLL